MFHRLIAAVIGMLTPAVAYAQYHITDTGWNCQGFLYCGAGTNIVTILTTHIITAVTAFIGALAIVVFIYGALRMVTSQGQEGKEAGKKALIWASFGLAAALLTGAIISYVNDYVYSIA